MSVTVSELSTKSPTRLLVGYITYINTKPQMNTISFTDLQTAHPYGVYSERFGCYYTVDYDSEMGYFRQLNDGSFENSWNFVDFDTLGDELREEMELIAAHICVNM